MIAENTHPTTNPKTQHWLDKPVLPWWPALTIEKLLLVLIIVLTILTRFYDVGARTMAHDEINHVVPGYNFEGYVYDPVTHGPFQFHALALSYFLFGDSDFSSRIPAALFGVGVVLFALFAWRRYLGRVGALIAGTLFMISPYILFYSRYTRNEIFIVFWGLVLLWLLLRYMEDGKTKWLYWLTFITAMHYTDKATSFIFSAEALIFLALLFIWKYWRREWPKERYKMLFQIASAATLCLIVLTLGVYILGKTPVTNAAPIIDPVTQESLTPHVLNSKLPLFASIALTGIAAVASIITLVLGLGWVELRKSRLFDLIALQLILILPLLVALPVKILGFDPQDYSATGILTTGGFFLVLLVISIILGLMWNKKVFLVSLAIFWGIFIVFYTTFFTHGEGFFKGIAGALGYWMSQQAVERGTQPLYYYALVQVPFYEYLPALGTILAIILGFGRRLFMSKTEDIFESPFKKKTEAIESEPETENTIEDQAETPNLALEEVPIPLATLSEVESAIEEDEVKIFAQSSLDVIEENAIEPSEEDPEEKGKPGFFQRLFSLPPREEGIASSLPILALLVFWSIMSLASFSIAGERMPWLTTHITMPMILTASFGLAYFVESLDWQDLKAKKGWLVLVLSIVFMVALFGLFGSLLGNKTPFQGKDLIHMQATSTFLLAALGTFGSGIGLFFLIRRWQGKVFFKFFILIAFALMGIQTARSAFRAAYINYDNAKELLVYAHATRDMKDSVEQIETISRRLYGDKTIKVAYDNDVRYPYWWYMRDYPNKVDFNTNVTKSLQDSPIIVVGSNNFSKIEPVVRDQYYRYDYKRMWWPNEEIYRNWTFKKVFTDLLNPAKRAGLWDLWFNRDYTKYAAAFSNPSLTLANWSPADNARMYIRKDVAPQIWELGISPEPVAPREDPYKDNTKSLDPVKVVTQTGDLSFLAPRDIATAPDGSLYIADSRNHRIIHIKPDGTLIKTIGSYGNTMDNPNQPGGMMNEPWGVAVDTNGTLYVADTWNHRIQVFDSAGNFLRMWSTFDVAGMPEGFWGPRGIALDAEGRVYVTDTGKQRVVVFEKTGAYRTQFGGQGLELGKLDEPVGIAIGKDGKVYVTDTWNQRVQVFQPSPDGMVFTGLKDWELDAWFSNSIENKPYLALDAEDNVYITDPDMGRVIVFDRNGDFKVLWGGFDNSYLMGVIIGITVGEDGSVWVSDSTNNSLLQFNLP